MGWEDFVPDGIRRKENPAVVGILAVLWFALIGGVVWFFIWGVHFLLNLKWQVNYGGTLFWIAAFFAALLGIFKLGVNLQHG